MAANQGRQQKAVLITERGTRVCLRLPGAVYWISMAAKMQHPGRDVSLPGCLLFTRLSGEIGLFHA